MTKRSKCSLSIIALACMASTLAAVSPSAAGPAIAVQPTILVDPCLSGAAGKTRNLESAEVSAKLAQPNVSQLIVPGGPTPSATCNGFIGDYVVSSSSKPPNGYSDALLLSAGWDSGSLITKKQCTESANTVKIYRKSSKTGFAYVGGGRLVGTWSPSAPPIAPGANGGTCAFAEAPDFKKVTGKVPAAPETDTYRVIFVSQVGSGTSTLARIKK